MIELVRRAYTPSDFLVGVNKGGEPVYIPAEPGSESLPGLIVFRFDSRLFYANASLFVDRIQELIAAAPRRACAGSSSTARRSATSTTRPA